MVRFLLSSRNKLLTSLLQESGWDETSHEDNRVVNLPIEWVLDIADKDNDWFLATAFGYNDMKQTLHVMVPDGINPTWTGDVAVNHLVRCFLSFVACRLDTVFLCHAYATWVQIGWGACSSVGAVNAACGRSVRIPSVGKHTYSTFIA